MTAETFASLKLHCLEPDADAAAALTGETAPEQEGVYAHAPQDVLSKMPGITPKNIRWQLRHRFGPFSLTHFSALWYTTHA